MSRRYRWAALLCLAVLVCAGCSGGPQTTTATAASPVPGRFGRIHAMLRRARLNAAAGNASAVRAQRREIVNDGLALIKARLPHDLRRADVPRFLAGRANFGDALVRWVEAVDGTDDRALFAAVTALDDALRGWMDAYLGLVAETAV